MCDLYPHCPFGQLDDKFHAILISFITKRRASPSPYEGVHAIENMVVVQIQSVSVLENLLFSCCTCFLISRQPLYQILKGKYGQKIFFDMLSIQIR
jgi:hypothetical protein